MPQITLTSTDRFPVGATVSAYPVANWPAHLVPPAGAPVGTAAASAVVGSDGKAVLTGLAPATQYVAYALVGAEHRYVSFRTGARGATEDEVLVASAARTASGQTGTVEGFDDVKSLRAQLNVSAVSGTTPTLDVVIEDTLDGSNWNAVGTFTQRTAVGRQVIDVATLGRRLRVRWTIGGTTPSFTFSVLAEASTV